MSTDPHSTTSTSSSSAAMIGSSFSRPAFTSGQFRSWNCGSRSRSDGFARSRANSYKAAA